MQIVQLKNIWSLQKEAQAKVNEPEVGEDFTQLIFDNFAFLQDTALFKYLSKSTPDLLNSQSKKNILTIFKFSSKNAKHIIDLFKQIVMLMTAFLRYSASLSPNALGKTLYYR